MILTLIYMYTTLMQWWRLGSLRNKLKGTLNGRNALLVTVGNSMGDAMQQRCLENLLFHKSGRLGCTIVPRQKINLNTWAAFPKDLVHFPIHIGYSNIQFSKPKYFIYMQALLNKYLPHEAETIEIEKFGELLAWRADSCFEVILQTDIDHITKLVQWFSSSAIDINHEMQLLKVETVDVEGTATMINYNKAYTTEQRLKYSYSKLQWQHFALVMTELYNKVFELSSSNPKITIENNLKREENKLAALSEVKPTKADAKTHPETIDDTKQKLDVRTKKSEHKLKTDRIKTAADKSVGCKSKELGHKSKSVHNVTEGARQDKTKDVTHTKADGHKAKTFHRHKDDHAHKAPEDGQTDVVDHRHKRDTRNKAKEERHRKDSEVQLKQDVKECFHFRETKTSTQRAHDRKIRAGTKSETDSNTNQGNASRKSYNDQRTLVNGTTGDRISLRGTQEEDLCNTKPDGENEAFGFHEANFEEGFPVKRDCNSLPSDIIKSGESSFANSSHTASKLSSGTNSSYATAQDDFSTSDTVGMCSEEEFTMPKESPAKTDLRLFESAVGSFVVAENGLLKPYKEASPDSSQNDNPVQPPEKVDMAAQYEEETKRKGKAKEKIKSYPRNTKSEVMPKHGDTKKEGRTFKVSHIIQEKNIVFEGKMKNAEKPMKNTSIRNAKPPNVLVYADSLMAKENVKAVLNTTLNKEKYTVYDLPINKTTTFWDDTTTLVVVCGNVTPTLTTELLQYLLNGGQLLCLCSDLLYSVLQTFTTAEVREHELVRFSYEEWKRVKMMHHIFCYQASPAKKQFSKDSDQSSCSDGSSPIAPRTPSMVEIQHNGRNYTIQVQVLGTEETWQTPSLLLASVKGSKGRAIFSQVHLEIDPTQYQDDESKYAALTDSNNARLEILKHILSNHLDIDCTNETCELMYTPAYFLGRHDKKLQMLNECINIKDNKLDSDKLSLFFCGKDEDPGHSSSTRLPIMVLSCPSNFSTVQYFETLETENIGRLVIYSDILTSSQHVIKHKLMDGLVVISRQQTKGEGRSSNTWISPLGCAMFSLQLHIPMKSTLGKSLPLVQHLVMVAIVSAIRSLAGYEKISIGLKWPNDLYAYSRVKVGGLVVNSEMQSDLAVVNVGCGINLDNSNPTTCINDIIIKYNEEEKANLQTIQYERFFAIVFNELERILKVIQNGDIDYLFDLYYKYWLHSDTEISVMTKEGQTRKVKIIGIDDFGYLTVRSPDGSISGVQPDGNTFDMLKGLIAPKIN